MIQKFLLCVFNEMCPKLSPLDKTPMVRWVAHLPLLIIIAWVGVTLGVTVAAKLPIPFSSTASLFEPAVREQEASFGVAIANNENKSTAENFNEVSKEGGRLAFVSIYALFSVVLLNFLAPVAFFYRITTLIHRMTERKLGFAISTRHAQFVLAAAVIFIFSLIYGAESAQRNWKTPFGGLISSYHGHIFAVLTGCYVFGAGALLVAIKNFGKLIGALATITLAAIWLIARSDYDPATPQLLAAFLGFGSAFVFELLPGLSLVRRPVEAGQRPVKMEPGNRIEKVVVAKPTTSPPPLDDPSDPVI